MDKVKLKQDKLSTADNSELSEVRKKILLKSSLNKKSLGKL